MTDTEVLSLISEQLRIPKEQLTAAVSLMQSSQAEAQELRKKLQDFATLNADITFNTPSGSVTFPSLKKMDAATKAQQDAVNSFFTATAEYNYVDSAGVTRKVKPLALMANAIGHPYAMSKAQFEANRRQNLEKYTASGLVHFGKHLNSAIKIGEGLWQRETEANVLRLGAGYLNVGTSKTDEPVIVCAGVVSHITQICHEDTAFNVIKFPPAEDGTRTNDCATGVSVKHATPALAFAAESETNKVVTDRVDMWGFEVFLREINESDPFVYAKGMIQSRADRINEVWTTDDNVRPISYFAWFKGDESSRGRGVNLLAASEEQRKAILSDPKNNIHFDYESGKFRQWCVRGRSFAGAGNGDWEQLDATAKGGSLDRFLSFGSAGATSSNGAIVQAQGQFDSSESFGGYSNGFSGPEAGVSVNAGATYQNGLWRAERTTFGVGGHCYFLVCGTVNRLNAGSYHPSKNPAGASAFWKSGGIINKWKKRAVPVSSKSECFDFSASAIEGKAISGGYAGKIGGESGRDDGRFYDVVYEGGQGGVCLDSRYSSNKVTLEDLQSIDLKCKSSNQRGLENLRKTVVLNENIAGIDGGHLIVRVDGESALNRPMRTSDCVSVHALINGSWISAEQTIVNPADQRYARSVKPAGVSDVIPATTQCIITFNLNISVASKLTHQDVAGLASEIVLCEDLKDGWLGGYINKSPTGVASAYKLTRPTKQGAIPFSIFSGGSWSESVNSADLTRNELTMNIPENGIAIVTYSTDAKVTKPFNVKPALNGPASIGDVYITNGIANDNFGRNFMYSLSGVIGTGEGGAVRYNENIPLKSIFFYSGSPFNGLDPQGFDTRNPKHELINVPFANSSGLKALTYFFEDNKKAYIGYIFAELKHNNSDWGDDGEIHPVHNLSSMQDDNLNYVICGAAVCVNPVGWL
ncbi:hypothetical protein [Pseudoalteromonas sp. Of7M-16]|uniref:hypothetical protein n=1 Tax=Pseudoalteromonas sp. Of7M-16 TaxID=2917756 RepID=UPI001EF67EDB|nr:hypothetical protein [Pseudoalteromonas sp. Of7M-16]MCG7550937.1 hypothetical protein [Pseudoalteromonas sp. Of7M-16]